MTLKPDGTGYTNSSQCTWSRLAGSDAVFQIRWFDGPPTQTTLSHVNDLTLSRDRRTLAGQDDRGNPGARLERFGLAPCIDEIVQELEVFGVGDRKAAQDEGVHPDSPRRQRLIGATNRPPEVLEHDLLARLPLRIAVSALEQRREDIEAACGRPIPRCTAALVASSEWTTWIP